MVVAVVAVLIGVLLPALTKSRDAARATVCLSNLRQVFSICRAYANDHSGYGPAIGQPYLKPPNWALVVQLGAERDGRDSSDLYTPSSVLACPGATAFHGRAMTRTYAMNATGHAGKPGDRGNFDDETSPAFINFDRVARPSDTPLLVDSAISAPPAGNAPPPTRTASVIDFREPAHIASRLGRYHGAGLTALFNAAMFDGSVRPSSAPEELWRVPLW